MNPFKAPFLQERGWGRGLSGCVTGLDLTYRNLAMPDIVTIVLDREVLLVAYSPLLVAQVTDTHLFADGSQEMLGCRTNQSFQAVVADIESVAASAGCVAADRRSFSR